ncbi:MAG: hypothetical protein FWF52_03265 [Candidatus Azobacteroides sp.]|nr:hypothetical protein [Candidatus Azobacteroides sp.]
MWKKVLTLLVVTFTILSYARAEKINNKVSIPSETLDSISKYIVDMKNANKQQELKIIELKNTISDLRSNQIDLKIALSKCVDQITGLRNLLTRMTEGMGNVQENTITVKDQTAITEKYNAEEGFYRKYLVPPKDSVNYKEIDDYVLSLNLMDRKPNNYQRLVSQIIRKSKTPYEKARAIYIWIAGNIVYDITSSVRDADETFVYRSGTCLGYASLFKKFCQIADLDVVTIEGFSRGFGFKKGDPLGNHVWNVVKISDSHSILVDVTWGAGFINKNGVFVRQIASYWFDTNPSLFALSHFPKEEKYQLIQNTALLTEDEFRTFPVIFPNVEVIGLSGESLLAHFRKTENKDKFPDIYPFAGLLKANEMPLTGHLTSGNKYRFSFIVPENYRIAVVQEGDWDYFVKGDNEVYTLEYTPVQGELSLNVNDGTQSTTYSSVFVYQVE